MGETCRSIACMNLNNLKQSIETFLERENLSIKELESKYSDVRSKFEETDKSIEDGEQNTLHIENYKWKYYVGIKNNLAYREFFIDQLKVLIDRYTNERDVLGRQLVRSTQHRKIVENSLKEITGC